MQRAIPLISQPALQIFWRQVRVLTASNLKSRYRKTVAGFLWVVLNPLIMYAVQSQVFKYVLKIQIDHYYLFLLSGLLPWIFICQTTEMCTPILQHSGPLLKAFPAHPLVYLTAQLLDNCINFIAAFLVILFPVLFIEHGSPRGLLFIPLPLILLTAALTGLVWFLSTLQVFFRDTKFILTFVLSVSYFVTPIFYPIEILPENFRRFVEFNPFYALILPFRICIYDFQFWPFIEALGHSAFVAFLFLALGLFFWRKCRNALYFHV